MLFQHFFHLHGSHGCFSFPSDDQSSHFFSFVRCPARRIRSDRNIRAARQRWKEAVGLKECGYHLLVMNQVPSLSRGIINRSNQHYANQLTFFLFSRIFLRGSAIIPSEGTGELSEIVNSKFSLELADQVAYTDILHHEIETGKTCRQLLQFVRSSRV